MSFRRNGPFFSRSFHRSFDHFYEWGGYTIRSLRLRAAISTLELEANELPNSEDVPRRSTWGAGCWVNGAT